MGTPYPETPRQTAIRRWLEKHGPCDLSRTERERLCGSAKADDVITWCEERECPYYIRWTRSPEGHRVAIPGVLVYGQDVAAVMGGWHFSDNFPELGALLRGRAREQAAETHEENLDVLEARLAAAADAARDIYDVRVERSFGVMHVAVYAHDGDPDAEPVLDMWGDDPDYRDEHDALADMARRLEDALIGDPEALTTRAAA